MNSYYCPHCEKRRGRMTALSVNGCLYFDSEIPPNERGSYGCPQCATNCCALCADELENICPCGGELVHGVWFVYNGDGRLPQEITRHPTLESRLAALDRLRSSCRMIRAEYDNYRRLITLSAKYARKYKVDLPENPGYYVLRDYQRAGGISPLEAWGLIADFAVPSNVEQMLDLLDKRCIEFVAKCVSSHPVDDEGWQQLEREYHDPKYHSDNEIPDRSPREMAARLRALVTTVRNALANRNAK